ncbi:uncharacterized protein LOC128243352 [Mya arenaria]|uniref:uncharacterized protein LOC128243352 n=1 Tax=Mya arenaria TaxID=6604 RepID=UPI0022E3D7C4|nr:uncharacterized protein LOC128243352 [Mya arenaria]
MANDRKSQQLMSMQLSRVLDDIGVSWWMVARRRRAALRREAMLNINSSNSNKYIFGSQTEGTTTTEMNSDEDWCQLNKKMNAVLDLNEWKQGVLNNLVVKNDQTPPQHCCLQRLSSNSPIPFESIASSDDVVDVEGRVLMSNTFFDNQIVEAVGKITYHGPSRHFGHEHYDAVFAITFKQIPDECKFLFQRPRPGHWPRKEILAEALQTGVFLVPQGFSESPHKPRNAGPQGSPDGNRLWRFSTPRMERLLMFDLSAVQIKVYVTLKILRKSYFKPVFGDRFSTFHLKTAILFTLESYPSSIWTDDNLIQCLIYCLTTLVRWARVKYCPHYTIADVNLFTGKLYKHEIIKLENMINRMVNFMPSYLFFIEMDSIGSRMKTLNLGIQSENLLSKKQMLKEIIIALLNKDKKKSISELVNSNTDTNYDTYTQSLTDIRLGLNDQLNNHGTEIEKEVAANVLSHVCNTLSTVKASRCIQERHPITKDILDCFQMSLDSDLSCRLKFASMLYCSGQYHRAADELTDCEGLLGSALWQCCTCKGRPRIKASDVFLEKALVTSYSDMIIKYVCLCVTFNCHELHCTPPHLRYEMYRKFTEADLQTRHEHQTWMDTVVVDPIPFFHYLQFLTYRHLNEHQAILESLSKLQEYLFKEGDHNGHIETVWNMIGHCFELYDRFDDALTFYTRSLQLYPTNNAAIWHIAIIVFHKWTEITGSFQSCTQSLRSAQNCKGTTQNHVLHSRCAPRKKPRLALVNMTKLR